MGNNQSRDDARSSGSVPSHHRSTSSTSNHPSSRRAERTGSEQPLPPHQSTHSTTTHHIHALTKRKSLSSASSPAHIIRPIPGSPVTSTTTEHAHAVRTASRPRSITLDAQRYALPRETASSHRSNNSAMGNEHSKQSSSHLEAHPAGTDFANPAVPNDSPTEPVDVPRAMTPPPAQPVDVPQPAQPLPIESQLQESDLPPMSYSESPYGLPPPNYSRPPRLPLPIEEEIYTPGSPIITPQEVSESLQQDGIAGAPLESRTSVLSSNADEDEEGDNDRFFAENSQSLQVRIPTRLEWMGPGQKIYVTGTFCAWDKKIKLHRNADGKGFSAILPLPPGTHHLKFLVDSEMVTNPDMPTTVDWSNILVNYFEVAAPAAPDTTAQPAVPIAIPGTSTATSQAARADDVRASPAEGGQNKSASLPVREKATPTRDTKPAERDAGAAKTALDGLPIARRKYTNKIPQFLADLDRYSIPDDERFARASTVTGTLPQPPTLPIFLSKSILNAGTPQKDDASVLVIPNHTVINHLATSSIKGGVLAVSGTTRYKRKYLTTMLYKPSSSDG